MARNVEIKARVSDAEAVRSRAERLSDSPVRILDQEDLFFHARKGRLKLRTDSTEGGELIFYRRPDRPGPKTSEYLIHRTDDPDTLRELLTAALGVRGVVRKRRTLYHVGATRIHLDDVERLGTFLELEVVLEPEQSSDWGAAIAARVLEELGMTDAERIANAYIDLLEQTES